MKNKSNYSNTWLTISQRKAQFGFVVFVGLLLATIHDLLLSKNLRQDICVDIFGAAIIYFWITTFFEQFLLCPRCHRSFYHSWGGSNSFSKTCTYCGLRYGAVSDERE
jgi:hypothetical protein